ncbi:MAG: CDP-alcohol phosphatidyltransferase family protein [Fibrobacterota bacterium]
MKNILHDGSVKLFNIPNSISISRIFADIALFGAVAFNSEKVFTFIFIYCAASDFLDGFIARLFHQKTPTGAFLDSMADFGMFGGAVLGLFFFKHDFISENYRPIIVLLTIELIKIFYSFIRYGKLSSFHTYSSKIAFIFSSIFIILLFTGRYYGWLFLISISFAIIATIEDILLMMVLPEWDNNKKGLFWILRK